MQAAFSCHYIFIGQLMLFSNTFNANKINIKAACIPNESLLQACTLCSKCYLQY